MVSMLRRKRGEPLPSSDDDEQQQQQQQDDNDYSNNSLPMDELQDADDVTNNNSDTDGIFHHSASSHRSLTEYIHEQINNATSRRRRSRCGTWCCRCLHLCNTFAVTLLCGAVVFLFVQLQMLKSEIIKDEDSIKDLQHQIQQQHISQQTLDQKVEKEHSFTIMQMAGTFTLLTCLITMFHITQHLSNWYEPTIQRKIITILWMSPIYSITSWLSLVFGTAADGYLSIINNVYEAYVIYTFLSFLIAVLGKGNRNVAIQVLSQHADHMKHPTRCFASCYHPPPDVSPEAKAGAVLLECQIWAMQFVLIRPFTSILRFVAETIISDKEQGGNSNNNMDGDGDNNNNWAYFESPMFVIDMITNVSVFLAFHGLLKFYHTVHHDLQWCQPFNKFVSIKSIVFLTFWQGLLISIVCSLNEEKERSMHNNSGTSSSINTGSEVIANNGTRYLLMRYMNNEDSSIIDGIMNFTDSEVNNIDTWINSTIGDDFNANDSTTPSTMYNNTSTYLDHNNSGIYPPSNYTGSSFGGSSAGGTSSSGGGGDSFASKSAREQAVMIQSFLICLEMLFFSIAHWCVFPAEEWQPEYRPKKFAKPGIGLKDFASDISYIVSSSSSARAYHKQRRTLQREQQRIGGTSSGDSYDDEDNSNSMSFHLDESSHHDLQLHANDADTGNENINNSININTSSLNPLDIIREGGHGSESGNDSLQHSGRPLMDSARRYDNSEVVGALRNYGPDDNIILDILDGDNDNDIVHIKTASIVVSPSIITGSDQDYAYDSSNLPALT